MSSTLKWLVILALALIVAYLWVTQTQSGATAWAGIQGTLTTGPSGGPAIITSGGLADLGAGVQVGGPTGYETPTGIPLGATGEIDTVANLPPVPGGAPPTRAEVAAATGGLPNYAMEHPDQPPIDTGLTVNATDVQALKGAWGGVDTHVADLTPADQTNYPGWYRTGDGGWYNPGTGEFYSPGSSPPATPPPPPIQPLIDLSTFQPPASTEQPPGQVIY